MKLSAEELEEHKNLIKYKTYLARFMSQKEQDRLLYLNNKIIHNSCINPKCKGYEGTEKEIICPFCQNKLFKFNPITLSNNKWIFSEKTSPLADTGDYESTTQITNGKDIFQTQAEDIENEQLEQFCKLLDLMPDLWSHKCDNAEFTLGLYKKEYKLMKTLLTVLKEGSMCSVLGEQMIELYFNDAQILE